MIVYQGETYTPTANITIANILFNMVISKNGACFICIDLSKFYLITPFNNKSDN